ncbi:MAG TPA: hypothetical protein VLW85_06345 [Myxococcales bacterium]|nr:hypothetical protein [Myxococcales bacterium]
MRTAALPRPQLQFALLASFVVCAECLMLARHPLTLKLESAVIFDLAVVPAGLWWLLVVRRGLASLRTVGTVAVLSVAACAEVFGAKLRLLAAPLELVLVYTLAREIRTSQSLPARALRTELSLFWYALFSWGRKAPAGFTAYKRAGWPAIYAAVLIMVFAEGLPLHFVLPRGWAMLSAALHVYTVLWVVGDLRAMKLRPIEVRGGLLHLRIGLRWQADIPLRDVSIGSAGTRGLKLGVIGSPNLVLKLARPVKLEGPYGITKTSDTLLLQVDDPSALSRALS